MPRRPAVAGPLIGLVGAVKYRGYIFLVLFRSAYQQTKEEVVRAGAVYYKFIPIVGPEYRLCRRIWRKFAESRASQSASARGRWLTSSYVTLGYKSMPVINLKRLTRDLHEFILQHESKLLRGAREDICHSLKNLRLTLNDHVYFQKKDLCRIVFSALVFLQFFQEDRFLRVLYNSFKQQQILRNQTYFRRWSLQWYDSLIQKIFLSQKSTLTQNPMPQVKLDLPQIKSLFIPEFKKLFPLFARRDGSRLQKQQTGSEQDAQSVEPREGDEEAVGHEAVGHEADQRIHCYKGPLSNLSSVRILHAAGADSNCSQGEEEDLSHEMGHYLQFAVEILLCEIYGIKSDKRYFQRATGEVLDIAHTDIRCIKMFLRSRRNGLWDYFRWDLRDISLAKNSKVCPWLSYEIGPSGLLLAGSPTPDDIGAYCLQLLDKHAFVIKEFALKVVQRVPPDQDYCQFAVTQELDFHNLVLAQDAQQTQNDKFSSTVDWYSQYATAKPLDHTHSPRDSAAERPPLKLRQQRTDAEQPTSPAESTRVAPGLQPYIVLGEDHSNEGH